ncbi:MAG: M16 family metallopeptidase [Blastocatellia bacterium]
MKEDIKETRFENGLVVLTDRMPGVRSATLGFFYRVGSRNEPNELNGITHFIEHCVFKGTQRRSAMELAIEQDRLGGNLDAFTTHEETGFVIKVIDDQIENAFDLLADMLTNPRFDAADLESEQRVIIEEMKMTEDSPEELLGDIFQREFFPKHPLGFSITGTPETVRSFGRETTCAYHKQNFNPGYLVIAAAGNVEHERLVEFASAAFTAQQAAFADKNVRVPATAAPIFVEHRPDLEQAHLIIATPLVSAKSERRYAADMLANIFGGGTSSRLWQKVREERGLAYSVGAAAIMYQDVGLFSVFAGTSPEQVAEVVDLSIAEMRDVVKNGVASEELELAKQQTRASILLGLEDSAARAATLAQSEMLHGRQITLDESLAKLDAVTTKAVHQLACEHFQTEKLAFAALGDLENLKIDRDKFAI